jgi:flagellar hook assembly protein FlgD
VFTVGANSVRQSQSEIAPTVRIDIYNIKGAKVRSLTNKTYPVGQHKVTWNGTDDAGKNVASGIYFYRFKADGTEATKKMLLLK